MANSVWDDLKMTVLHGNNSLIHLIAINIIAFIVMMLPLSILALFQIEGASFVREYFFLSGNPFTVLRHPWTLITYFFLHSPFSFGHIFWNMIWLWWIGKIFQDLMGNKRTISLYFLGGIAGGLAYILLSNLLPILNPEIPLVGASAAVMAFVVASATLVPHYTIRLLFLGNIKIWWIAAFFILSDLLFLGVRNPGGGIAHLAGAGIGYLYVRQLQKGNDFGAWVNKVLGWFKLAFSKGEKQNLKVHRTERAPGGNNRSEPSQEEIDVILDKIAKSGYDSLSKHEREILFRASKE